jgi:hypothetical protein
MCKFSSNGKGIVALVLAAIVLLFVVVEPDRQRRYADALFVMIGIGIGLRRLRSLKSVARK